ncbi:MAG: hypothetical protein IJT16_00025 [Lachnospiraceae bacterium]|nr:hypothetical protein [Lachnospiraceae bacterium]
MKETNLKSDAGRKRIHNKKQITKHIISAVDLIDRIIQREKDPWKLAELGKLRLEVKKIWRK